VGFRLVTYIGLEVQTYICSRTCAYCFVTKASAVYDYVKLNAFVLPPSDIRVLVWYVSSWYEEELYDPIIPSYSSSLES
jgi:hypothetical protein